MCRYGTAHKSAAVFRRSPSSRSSNTSPTAQGRRRFGGPPLGSGFTNGSSATISSGRSACESVRFMQVPRPGTVVNHTCFHRHAVALREARIPDRGPVAVHGPTSHPGDPGHLHPRPRRHVRPVLPGYPSPRRRPMTTLPVIQVLSPPPSPSPRAHSAECPTRRGEQPTNTGTVEALARGDGAADVRRANRLAETAERSADERR